MATERLVLDQYPALLRLRGNEGGSVGHFLVFNSAFAVPHSPFRIVDPGLRQGTVPQFRAANLGSQFVLNLLVSFCVGLFTLFIQDAASDPGMISRGMPK